MPSTWLGRGWWGHWYLLLLSWWRNPFSMFGVMYFSVPSVRMSATVTTHQNIQHAWSRFSSFGENFHVRSIIHRSIRHLSFCRWISKVHVFSTWICPLIRCRNSPTKVTHVFSTYFIYYGGRWWNSSLPVPSVNIRFSKRILINDPISSWWRRWADWWTFEAVWSPGVCMSQQSHMHPLTGDKKITPVLFVNWNPFARELLGNMIYLLLHIHSELGLTHMMDISWQVGSWSYMQSWPCFASVRMLLCFDCRFYLCELSDQSHPCYFHMMQGELLDCEFHCLPVSVEWFQS